MEHELARITRVEALERAAAGAVCLLPVGALEQHGEHLPVGTDALVVEAVCLRAAELAAADVLVAPVLWTGFSPHHVRFGATVSLAAATFLALVRETLAGLAAWLPRVLVVNGHGGNRGPLTTIALETGCEAVSYWELVRGELLAELFPVDEGSIGHAGEAETSLLLALAPGLVGEPAARFEPIPGAGAALLAPDLGESGVLGDARAASADAGRRFLDAVAAALAASIDRAALPTTKEHTHAR